MNKKQQEAILSESFGFDAAESLQKQLKKYEKQGLTPQDWREMADSDIAHLNACLEREMDRPTWGPKEDHDDLREDISSPSKIWEDSRRINRFRPIYFGAAFIGIGLFALAMAVDYSIINEFWKRALANEFLEVPEALANSILFKSLQVVIAAFAVHFFLSSLKNRRQERGEKAYVATLFVLTIVMITGFGILVTKQTMPANEAAILGGAPLLQESIPDDPFANFLDSSAAEPAVVTSAAAVEAAMIPPDTIQRLYSISWMIAPAIVFLIATGVGAWSLQLSETNLENFVKAGDFKARDGQMRQLAMLEKSQKLLDRMSNRQSDYDI